MPDLTCPQAALWDIDGTLIDTTALIVDALDVTFRKYIGTSLPPDELRALIGVPLDAQMRALGDPAEFGTSVEEMAATAIVEYEKRRSQEHIIDEALLALIYAKRRGVKTALVTSKNDVELTNTLPRLGISAYCDIIISADRVAPDFKPHPRGVLLALELLGVSNPSDAVYIGDSVHDMRAAHGAGVRSAAVLWGAAPASALRAEKPNWLIENPEELIPTLFACCADKELVASAG
ncbi:MAG TPA: HAD family hydrolase [Capsulimonadaceae bacterium]|nr:HAD family hydrolase [Capsulimonadaceae bacterium]